MISFGDVLTLLLVIFTALSYLDNHNNKKKITSQTLAKFRMLFF